MRTIPPANLSPADPARIAAIASELCAVCDKALGIYEARMMFPGHDVQLHMGCGETPRTFYTPVNGTWGPAATVWTKEQAEAQIVEEIAAGDEGDEDLARDNWEIREDQMTPGAYYQLREFDGF